MIGPMPASDEVALAHVGGHRCNAGVDMPIQCGCESVAPVACTACGEPLAIRTLPGRSLRCHGLEVLEPAKVPGPWAPWSTWPGVREESR